MLRDIRSVTVVRSSTLPPCGPPGPRRAAARSDSVARALERPACFSACRECCVSAYLVAGCGGGVSRGFCYTIYGLTDLRIHPPPSPSRGPAVRRASTNQVGAGVSRGVEGVEGVEGWVSRVSSGCRAGVECCQEASEVSRCPRWQVDAVAAHQHTTKVGQQLQSCFIP